MKRIVPAVLALLFLLPCCSKPEVGGSGEEEQGSGKPGTESLFTQKNRIACLAYLEKYLGTESEATKADAVLAKQQADGSFTGIDYADTRRSGWSPCTHITNIRTLACAVYVNARKDCLDAIYKAIDYWCATNPTCTNWWYNEIYVPQTLGPCMLLIRERLDNDHKAKVLSIMDKAYIGRTGQNKVWLSGNVLLRGLIAKDEAQVYEARASILEEIVIMQEGEGIRPDWSFHQHGAQLQFGNYGLSYVTVLADWFESLKGTPLEIDARKRKLMENYIYYGVSRVLWKDRFDMNACGRQVNKGSQRSKATSLLNAMAKMGFEEKPFVGPSYYPYSDFGIYRTDNWYASIRMQSARTVGYEMVNSENMMSYFSADGALLVRRNGREYEDVSAVWNWRHVPGVTAYDDGSELYGKTAKKPYNDTEKVFGLAEGDYLIAAMDLVRDGLTARKAWFFCPKGIVCLGTGISRAASDPVTTAVEQCLVDGSVTQGERYYRHNGITYISMEGTILQAPLAHSGNWKVISPNSSDATVTSNLLDLYIDHGSAPSGASYCYAVVPDGSSAADALAWVDGSVQIVTNNSDWQTVRLGDTTLSVNWTDAKATVSKAQ
ncbi:MAG: hypothetical protein IJV01_06640 [Bacteroidales bacterium]|nr:hypothetical protein [Bacteroidales bacterium]